VETELVAGTAHRIIRMIAMAGLLGVGFFFAGRTVYWLLRYVAWGEGSIEWKNIPGRIKDFIIYVIGQRRVIQEPAGLTHLFIFWGFLILQLETIEYFIRGIQPGLAWTFGQIEAAVPALDVLIPTLSPHFHFSTFIGLGGYDVLLFSQDIFGALVFVAITIAAIRRFIVRPAHAVVSADGAIILGLIGALMVTKFIANGAEIAYVATGHFEGDVGAAMAFISGAGLRPEVMSSAIQELGHTPAWTPVATLMADWFVANGIGRSTVFWMHHANYWLHVAIVIAFANYIPFGKHLHLIGAMPNIFFKKEQEPKGPLLAPDLDFEDYAGEQVGAANVEDLDWKQLLDSYACTECARCEHYCPAYNTGKPLNPYMIVHKIKETLRERGEHMIRNGGDEEDLDLERLTGGVISKEELWACTTCGACVEACPVFIEHVDSIVDMRRYLATMEADFSQEVGRTFRNMERNMNPWGISQSFRADWAEELDVPLMSELSESPEYLFWVGCAGSFDDRQKEVTRSFTKIMKAADVSFAILGPEETCTGDPARRIGNEYLYWMLAKQNVDTLNDYGVTKIVTTCPHCFHTIGKEYPQLGGDYEVVHHTQLLNELLADGRIELEGVGSMDITYHDSCYIGRWDDSYENPRNVLGAVPGVKVQEMELNKEQSFCCGAGGGRMWMEEDIGKRVNVERTDQALDTDPDAIAVNCPFCMTMFTDGLKTRDAENVPLKDLAEIVADNLEDQDASTDEPKAAAE
jgi:Fe-S oxidoreductase